MAVYFFKIKQMKFHNKYRILLYKNYLDTGLGLTYYLKYLILLFGVMSMDVKNTIFIIIAYVIISFILGYCWFRFGWMEANTEVSNRFNKFVKEMRNSVKRKA